MTCQLIIAQVLLEVILPDCLHIITNSRYASFNIPAVNRRVALEQKVWLYFPYETKVYQLRIYLANAEAAAFQLKKMLLIVNRVRIAQWV
jgi:hypothetical protein